MPKNKELTPSERADIYNKRAEGMTFKEIANRYNISSEGVRKICGRLDKRGSAENSPRPGRPRKTTDREDREIVKMVKKNPKISAKEIKDNISLPISLTRIRERIKDAGLGCYVARKKPLLRQQNIEKRLLFARLYFDNPDSFWHSVIWSDESKFELFSSNRRVHVYRKKGEAFKPVNIQPTVKHGGGSVMVWGCFSYHGIGKLVFIDERMTGETYVEIIKNNLSASATMMGIENDFVFQQDNDPKHSSRIATKYFETNQIPVLPWPPQSPDLNPIEHLWDHLDRQIPPSMRKNKQMFKEAIVDQWSKIPLEFLQNLVLSMPRRLQEVLKAKGGHTRY